MKYFQSIIVGGGVAGLSCGYELSKNGFNSLIIEKMKYLGGRASSEIVHEHILDRGAVYLMYPGKNILTYLEEFNQQAQLKKVPHKRALFFDNGNFKEIDFSDYKKFFLSILKSDLLSLKTKSNPKTLSFLSKCVSNFRKIKESHDNWEKFNTGNARQLLEKYFSKEEIDNIFDPVCESILLNKTENLSTAILYALIGCLLDNENSLYYFKNGMGTLSKLLEENYIKNNGKITNEEVIKISKEKKYFLVKTKKRTYRAKTVIYCANMNNIDQLLGHKITNSTIQYNYRKAIVVQIGISNKIDKIKNEHLVFFNEKSKSPFVFLSEISAKNTQATPSGKGLLYILLRNNFSDKKISNEKILKVVTDYLYSLFGDIKSEINFTKIYRWNHGLPVLNTNYFFDKEISTPIKGLFICGDSRFIGIDGVIESAKRSSSKCIEFIKE